MRKLQATCTKEECGFTLRGTRLVVIGKVRTHTDFHPSHIVAFENVEVAN